MKNINLNENVIIYPSEYGWKKIKEIVVQQYHDAGVPEEHALEYIRGHKTDDDGYREQLWCIISDFHEMFYNGTRYFDKVIILIE